MFILSTYGNKNKVFIFILIFFLFAATIANCATLGDVNSDYNIDIIDALLVARYFVGTPVSLFNQVAADVDGNHQVNIVDALLISQYTVGIINKFPAQLMTPTPTPTATPTPIATQESTPIPTLQPTPT